MTLYRLTDTGLRPANQPRPRHHQPNRAWRSTARWRHLRALIVEAQPWCTTCGSTTDLTVDHTTPVHHGGAIYDPINLQVLCRPCNSRKGAA